MNFNKLNLEEKFGQMILLGLDTYEINNEIIELIQKYKIGGVVLYKKNYTSLETMIEVINKLKKINMKNSIPLFIAVDQENGSVNRFPKDINRIYSANKQSKTENMKIIHTVNKLTTYILSSIGINMNFAPVLDVDNKNKAIGSRSYGKNATEVLKYALPFMKELQDNNIISVVKYFPKIGATSRDNLFFLPKIKDLKSLNNDIVVFEEAIKNNADAIMVSHIKIKGYGMKPASLNKRVINELLINKYQFKGLIVTDDLRMRSLKGGLKRRIKNSIESGNNVLLVKYKKGDINRIYRELFKMVNRCEIDPELVNNSAKKIVAMKKKYNLSNELLSPRLEIELINNKIKNINNAIEKEIM
ncbi:MAG: hypothetical protein E7161_05460 [Firmicutes bacterium]|nr:hypothetical protein [Bacillota bacterium]